jgi:hypothetical protein
MLGMHGRCLTSIVTGDEVLLLCASESRLSHAGGCTCCLCALLCKFARCGV